MDEQLHFHFEVVRIFNGFVVKAHGADWAGSWVIFLGLGKSRSVISSPKVNWVSELFDLNVGEAIFELLNASLNFILFDNARLSFIRFSNGKILPHA